MVAHLTREFEHLQIPDAFVSACEPAKLRCCDSQHWSACSVELEISLALDRPSQCRLKPLSFAVSARRNNAWLALFLRGTWSLMRESGCPQGSDSNSCLRNGRRFGPRVCRQKAIPGTTDIFQIECKADGHPRRSKKICFRLTDLSETVRETIREGDQTRGRPNGRETTTGDHDGRPRRETVREHTDGRPHEKETKREGDQARGRPRRETVRETIRTGDHTRRRPNERETKREGDHAGDQRTGDHTRGRPCGRHFTASRLTVCCLSGNQT